MRFATLFAGLAGGVLLLAALGMSSPARAQVVIEETVEGDTTHRAPTDPGGALRPVTRQTGFPADGLPTGGKRYNGVFIDFRKEWNRTSSPPGRLFIYVWAGRLTYDTQKKWKGTLVVEKESESTERRFELDESIFAQDVLATDMGDEQCGLESKVFYHGSFSENRYKEEGYRNDVSDGRWLEIGRVERGENIELRYETALERWPDEFYYTLDHTARVGKLLPGFPDHTAAAPIFMMRKMVTRDDSPDGAYCREYNNVFLQFLLLREPRTLEVDFVKPLESDPGMPVIADTVLHQEHPRLNVTAREEDGSRLPSFFLRYPDGEPVGIQMPLEVEVNESPGLDGTVEGKGKHVNTLFELGVDEPNLLDVRVRHQPAYNPQVTGEAGLVERVQATVRDPYNTSVTDTASVNVESFSFEVETGADTVRAGDTLQVRTQAVNPTTGKPMNVPETDPITAWIDLWAWYHAECMQCYVKWSDVPIRESSPDVARDDGVGLPIAVEEETLLAEDEVYTSLKSAHDVHGEAVTREETVYGTFLRGPDYHAGEATFIIRGPDILRYRVQGRPKRVAPGDTTRLVAEALLEGEEARESYKRVDVELDAVGAQLGRLVGPYEDDDTKLENVAPYRIAPSTPFGTSVRFVSDSTATAATPGPDTVRVKVSKNDEPSVSGTGLILIGEETAYFTVSTGEDPLPAGRTTRVTAEAADADEEGFDPNFTVNLTVPEDVPGRLLLQEKVLGNWQTLEKGTALAEIPYAALDASFAPGEEGEVPPRRVRFAAHLTEDEEGNPPPAVATVQTEEASEVKTKAQKTESESVFYESVQITAVRTDKADQRGSTSFQVLQTYGMEVLFLDWSEARQRYVERSTLACGPNADGHPRQVGIYVEVDEQYREDFRDENHKLGNPALDFELATATGNEIGDFQAGSQNYDRAVTDRLRYNGVRKGGGNGGQTRLFFVANGIDACELEPAFRHVDVVVKETGFDSELARGRLQIGPEPELTFDLPENVEMWPTLPRERVKGAYDLSVMENILEDVAVEFARGEEKIAGKNITVTAEWIKATGGHVHAGGSKTPPEDKRGRFKEEGFRSARPSVDEPDAYDSSVTAEGKKSITIESDEEGTVEFDYKASQIGGRFTLKAQATYQGKTYTGTAEVKVRVPGLVRLPLGGTGYVHKEEEKYDGEDASHPGFDKYGAPDVIENLQAIARAWKRLSEKSGSGVKPIESPLVVNEISVPNGGLMDFEDGGNWSKPHQTHRVGRDIDLRASDSDEIDDTYNGIVRGGIEVEEDTYYGEKDTRSAEFDRLARKHGAYPLAYTHNGDHYHVWFYNH